MSCKGCGAPIEYPKCSYCGRIPPSKGPSVEEIAKAIWDTPVKNYSFNENFILTSTGMISSARTLLTAMGLDLEEKEEKKKSYSDFWKKASAERRRNW